VSEILSGDEWRRVAVVTLERSLGLRSGQSVAIDAGSHGVHLAEVLAREARRLGIRPVIFHQPRPPRQSKTRKGIHGDPHALSRLERAAASATDGYIFLASSIEESQERDRLPPLLRQALDRRDADLTRTLVEHSVRSVRLMPATMSESAARLFQVDIQAWKREILSAIAVDPKVLRRTALPMARRLVRGKRVTIQHSNGTHLELGLAGRTPLVDDGVVDVADEKIGRFGTILPGGFLVVAVDETIAEGRFVSNRPTRSRRGTIESIEWVFRNGRLAGFGAGRGRALLTERYRRAGRERNRPAALEIGLNPELHDSPLGEDQELGAVSVEIGRNDVFGGRSRGSFFEFATLRGATLLVDDRPILKDGRPCS
jgi:leucyl aminopeptidase (aminopeptidase T)